MKEEERDPMAMADIIMGVEEEQTVLPVQEPLVFGFTLLQTQHYYNRVMSVVEKVQPPPISVFHQLQEEHQLVEDQLGVKHTSDVVVATMVVADLSIVNEQRAVLDFF